ncbi:MAG: GlsB/YeaQ/YmgE family stress response membrane protein [Chloroflexaceae bacterium]|nr:GlsB/YeaQ/YmgE family stress response membrane protein [Chloroflexaceae bacterium]
MGFLSWIIMGALAGWIAGIVTQTKDRRGCIGNIILGVVGAFVGGLLMQFLTGQGFDFGFDLASLVVAVLGAVVVLALVGVARKSQKK